MAHAEEEMLKEVLEENPVFKDYLESLNAKLYYCDRTDCVRVSGSDQSGEDDFDLSLELFISISNKDTNFVQPKKAVLTRVR